MIISNIYNLSKNNNVVLFHICSYGNYKSIKKANFVVFVFFVAKPATNIIYSYLVNYSNVVVVVDVVGKKVWDYSNFKKNLKMTEIEYENKILGYMDSQPKGWEKELFRLTDDKEKFTNAIKKLMDEGFLTDISFSNNYKYLIKCRFKLI